MAIKLAQDEALVPATVFKSAKIISSDTRKRILTYRDRIKRENMLAECAATELPDAYAVEAERRAKKAKQRHDQREHWAEVRGVLDGIIGQLERRRPNAPSGCDSRACSRGAALLGARRAHPTAGGGSFGSSARHKARSD